MTQCGTITAIPVCQLCTCARHIHHSPQDVKETYSADLLATRVVVELSACAYVAGCHASVLLQHRRSAEVVGEEGAGNALGHAGVVQPPFIDLLHHMTRVPLKVCPLDEFKH